jgi:hypothetical protein
LNVTPVFSLITRALDCDIPPKSPPPKPPPPLLEAPPARLKMKNNTANGSTNEMKDATLDL